MSATGAMDVPQPGTRPVPLKLLGGNPNVCSGEMLFDRNLSAILICTALRIPAGKSVQQLISIRLFREASTGAKKTENDPRQKAGDERGSPQ